MAVPAKSARPRGWGPEMVLRWLEENPAGKLQTFLQRLAEDGFCQAHTLRQDIGRWKKQNPRFRELYREAVRERHNASDAHQLPLEYRLGTEDWMVTFCAEYVSAGGDKNAAAAKVGISLSTVLSRLRDGDAGYNPHFAKLYQAAEAVLVARAEAGVWEALEGARAEGDNKTLGFIALQILERLDPKWSRRQEQHVKGHIEHTHTVRERRERATGVIAQVNRKLFGEGKSEEAQDVEYRELASTDPG